MDQQTNQKRFPSVCSVWDALLKLIGQDTATSLQTRQNTANQSLFKLCCIQGLFFHSHKSGKLVGFNDSRGAVSCTWMHHFLIFHVKFCRQWMQHLSVLAEHHGNRSLKLFSSLLISSTGSAVDTWVGGACWEPGIKPHPPRTTSCCNANQINKRHQRLKQQNN